MIKLGIQSFSYSKIVFKMHKSQVKNPPEELVPSEV